MLEEHGVAGRSRSASTSSSRRFLFEMQSAGIDGRDAQQLMLDARQIKSADEIMLLSQAAAMVDGVYQDIVEALKPGVRENEIVALANKRLYEMGSDDVEAINAVSGERCNPHPHNFTDRLIRPGDQAFFDIIQSFNGLPDLLLPHLRGRQRDRAASATRTSRRGSGWTRAIDAGPARASAPTQSPRAGPTATEFGFEQRDGGVRPAVRPRPGLGLHERPIISPAQLARDPIELKVGMVFALETYCPATRRLLRGPHRGGGRDHRGRAASCSRSSRRRNSWSPTHY